MGAVRRIGGAALAVALACALAAVGSAPTVAAPAPDERPNVVVIMTDDQTQDSIRYMDRVNELIAGRGATFANSFTNWPLCCPSRATLLTGQYAHNHGILGNELPAGGVTRLDDANTLPVWLQAAGYHTVHVGKYLNGYGTETDSVYVPPGWDEWYGATAGTTQSVYDYTLNENGTLVDYAAAESDFKQDVFTGLAVDAITRQAPAGPLMLAVMYTAPHGGGPNPNPNPPADCGNGAAKPAPRHATVFEAEPLPQPPNFNETDVSDKPLALQDHPPITTEEFANIERRYRCRIESLLSVDEGVARIVAALDAVGELDETLIVFTSDNGFFAGEHRVRSGKNRVYEEAIRVPLLVRGPGIRSGTWVEEPVVNADLAATIADAAGAMPGRELDGRSLLPLAEHPERRHGRELLIDRTGVFAAVRTARYLLAENATGERELYDLDADPYQLQNQVANPGYDAVEAALAARLAALRTCAGASCRAKPALKQRLPRSVRANGRSCRRPGEFLVRLRGPDARKAIEARFFVGSRHAARDRTAPIKRELRPRLLRDERKPEISVLATLIDGRATTVRKRVRICR